MENRLYVGNLAFQTTEGELMTAFAPFGAVTEVKLVLDRESGRSRGFAFVSMADGDGARKAIAEMNGALLAGRALRVNEAEAKPARSGAGIPGEQAVAARAGNNGVNTAPGSLFGAPGRARPRGPMPIANKTILERVAGAKKRDGRSRGGAPSAAGCDSRGTSCREEDVGAPAGASVR